MFCALLVGCGGWVGCLLYFYSLLLGIIGCFGLVLWLICWLVVGWYGWGGFRGLLGLILNSGIYCYLLVGWFNGFLRGF